MDFDGGPEHPLVRTLPPVIVVPLDDVATLGPTLDLLFGEVDNVRCGRAVLADRLFEVLLIQLYRWILDHVEQLALPRGLIVGLGDRQLASALVAIHRAPGEPWTLEAMARAAHLSRSTFAERFKALVGQSPGDYLAEWRLLVAKERLRSGRPVAVTAHELGYSGSSAFSRAFTQRVGQSPRAWLAALACDSGVP